MKYVLVSGGVISGIGKGVIASSLGMILKSCGIRVTSIKIDPYINIDAGTFSPYEHGLSQWNYYFLYKLKNTHNERILYISLENIDFFMYQIVFGQKWNWNENTEKNFKYYNYSNISHFFVVAEITPMITYFDWQVKCLFWTMEVRLTLTWVTMRGSWT